MISSKLVEFKTFELDRFEIEMPSEEEKREEVVESICPETL